MTDAAKEADVPLYMYQPTFDGPRVSVYKSGSVAMEVNGRVIRQMIGRWHAQARDEPVQYAELSRELLRDSSLFMRTQLLPGEFNSLADRIDRFLDREPVPVGGVLLQAARRVSEGWQSNMTVIEEYDPLVNELRAALVMCESDGEVRAHAIAEGVDIEANAAKFRKIVEDNIAKREATVGEGLTLPGWHPASEAPPVPKGGCKTFIIAVRRESGKVYTFPAEYLNAMGLLYDDDRPVEADGDDEGMTVTTGWHEPKEHSDFDTAYYALDLNAGKDELLGWAALPAWNERAPEGGLRLDDREELRAAMVRTAKATRNAEPIVAIEPPAQYPSQEPKA